MGDFRVKVGKFRVKMGELRVNMDKCRAKVGKLRAKMGKIVQSCEKGNTIESLSFILSRHFVLKMYVACRAQ